MQPRLMSISLLLVGLCLGAVGPVQAEWVPMSGPEAAAPTVRIGDEESSRIVLEFEVPGFTTKTVEIDGRTYTGILMPGLVPLLQKGLPELPVLSRCLVIPAEGTPQLRILSRRYREFPVDPVVPSKGPLSRDIDPATVPYEFADLYREGGVFPAREAELTEPFILRDYRGVAVRFHPLRYDVDRGVLMALQSLTVEVVTTGTGGVNAKQRLSRVPGGGQFEGIYRDLFLNPPARKYDPIPGPGPLLIVCHDAFVAEMDSFVAWKRQKGLPVELITTSAVGGTAAGIQDAIYLRYNSPAGLTYVILVGDIDQVPTNTGTYHGADSDPIYCLVEGDDLYPDLFLSRISAETPDQVRQQVAKFIGYERDPVVGGDWYHRATGIASNQGSPSDAERCDLLRDDLLGYTFTDVDQIYQGQGGSAADIFTALTEGRSLINYLGHGSGTGWTSVPFTNDDVHTLSNGGMYPWIIDVACSNGKFSLPECFAEAWLRAGSVAQPTGAVAMYAASTLASWVPPCLMQAEAVDLLVAETENTIGALFFSGALKVLDDYPGLGGEGHKLVEQYNIFGDCSLVVRTDTPAPLSVSHLPVFPLGAPSFAVDAPGLAGATACLYRDGTIHGTAVTDGSGHADILLDVPIQSGGDLTLTVTAYNHTPYITTLPALVPASVTITPDSIPCGVSTPVTVTVLDTLGAGLPDVTVWIEGFGVSGLVQTTDPAGEAPFGVNPLYGETLQVRGREPGATYDLFTLSLPVYGAADLTGPTLTAEVPAIGLSGALTPFIEGTVMGSALETGLDLFLAGCGIDTTAGDPGSSVTIAVAPDQTGEVTATLAGTGYNLFASAIPVVEAFGTLAGLVHEQGDPGTPIACARVCGYPAGADTSGTAPIFDLPCDGGGNYAVPDSLVVGYYDLYVSQYGYLSHEEPIFLAYGPNVLDVGLTTAPTGVLSGTVTDAEGGSPLAATIEVYRADTLELITTATTDTVDGSYSTDPLPYFTFRLITRATFYLPQTVTQTVDQSVVVRDFVLDPANGNLLVIDDGGPRCGSHPAKLGKDGAVLAPGYSIRGPRSATEFATDLAGLGYTVTVEEASLSNPLTWPDFDLVILACGDNALAVDDSTFRAAIEAFVAGDGRLLVEGGDVGYRSVAYPGFPSFAADVLHCNAWHQDNGGSVTVNDPVHHVMSVPNTVQGPIAVSYAGFADKDVMTPAAEAAVPGSWDACPGRGSIVAYDANPAPEGGQIVFFTFNYAAMHPAARPGLLQNVVTWLMVEEVADCAVSGAVTLVGQTDHSGVLIEAIPGGGSQVTTETGEYSLTGLYPGPYQIVASKEGWTTATAEIHPAQGQHLTDVDFELLPVVTSESCRSPLLPIPDNNPTGVTDTLTVTFTQEILAIEVFVSIKHTYIGDLVVELTSPMGTTVRLHNRSGGGADDLYGWYPDDLTSFGDLSDFLGEDPSGDWVLWVADFGGSDFGTFDAWCLRIDHPANVTAVGDGTGIPAVLALGGNYPNPFNPRTSIVFSVPRLLPVDLAVYDLRGRLVTTLVRENLVPGRHEVMWNGTDAAGRRVASGLYFAKLQAGGQVFTSKMLLLK